MYYYSIYSFSFLFLLLYSLPKLLYSQHLSFDKSAPLTNFKYSLLPFVLHFLPFIISDEYECTYNSLGASECTQIFLTHLLQYPQVLKPAEVAKTVYGVQREDLSVIRTRFSSELARIKQTLLIHHEKFYEPLKKSIPRLEELEIVLTLYQGYVVYGVPQLGSCVARGNYGSVYIGSWGRLKDVAIKALTISDPEEAVGYAHEMHILRTVQNMDNFSHMYGCSLDLSKVSPGEAFRRPYTPHRGLSIPLGVELFIIMDKYDSNLELLAKSLISEERKLSILIPLAESVRRLHEIGYMHRDLKLDNVLSESKYIHLLHNC